MKKFLILAVAVIALASCQKANGGLELGHYVCNTSYHGVLNAELMDGGQVIFYFDNGRESWGHWEANGSSITLHGSPTTADHKHTCYLDREFVGKIKSSQSFYVDCWWDYGENRKKGFLSFSKRN